jgi:hypothetical protein
VTEEGPPEGAWIFLSHSHKDLDKVRRIRDELEAQGHNPLMFFLKCLDDAAELDDLIRREIEARTWFILCGSANAKASRWVQEEIRIIKGLEGKVYEEIDLDAELETQVEGVTALSKRATVFISHASSDLEVAREIGAALRREDFAVFDPEKDIRPGSSWLDASAGKIEEAAARGFVLILLSRSAMGSVFVEWEVASAFKSRPVGGNIIPIAIEAGVVDALPPALRHRIDESRVFDLASGDREERIAELVRLLKTHELE